ncbi:MAG: M56 family metallopeptidase [Chloroflexi bacterium]|nr:M56 family metallopeptidase [Chloroflexota bacterium]
MQDFDLRTVVALLDKTSLRGVQTRAVAIPATFAAALLLLGLDIWFRPHSLSPIVIAYQKACTQNPYLLSCSKQVLSHLPTFFSLGLVISSLLAAGWTLWGQLRKARRLSRIVETRACPAPRKLVKAATGLGILDDVICVRDERLYAFCHGIRNMQICVSTGVIRQLSQEELRAGLLHESCHLRNRDPLKLLGMRVVTSAFRMLPVVGELRQRYQLAKEIEADHLAAQGTSLVSLANALLKVFTSDQHWPDPEQAPAGAFSVTEERIIRLAGGNAGKVPPISRGSVLASLFVGVALFVSTFGLTEASGYWTTRGQDCRPLVDTYKAARSVHSVGVSRCAYNGTHENVIQYSALPQLRTETILGGVFSE